MKDPRPPKIANYPRIQGGARKEPSLATRICGGLLIAVGLLESMAGCGGMMMAEGPRRDGSIGPSPDAGRGVLIALAVFVLLSLTLRRWLKRPSLSRQSATRTLFAVLTLMIGAPVAFGTANTPSPISVLLLLGSAVSALWLLYVLVDPAKQENH